VIRCANANNGSIASNAISGVKDGNHRPAPFRTRTGGAGGGILSGADASTDEAGRQAFVALHIPTRLGRGPWNANFS